MILEACRSQESRIVVCTSILVLPDKSTEKATAFSTMVANRATESRHSNRICQNQEQEEKRYRTLSMVRVPDRQTFSLESRHVSQAGEQEGVEVVRGFWSRNDAP